MKALPKIDVFGELEMETNNWQTPLESMMPSDATGTETVTPPTKLKLKVLDNGCVSRLGWQLYA